MQSRHIRGLDLVLFYVLMSGFSSDISDPAKSFFLLICKATNVLDVLFLNLTIYHVHRDRTHGARAFVGKAFGVSRQHKRVPWGDMPKLRYVTSWDEQFGTFLAVHTVKTNNILKLQSCWWTLWIRALGKLCLGSALSSSQQTKLWAPSIIMVTEIRKIMVEND